MLQYDQTHGLRAGSDALSPVLGPQPSQAKLCFAHCVNLYIEVRGHPCGFYLGAWVGWDLGSPESITSLLSDFACVQKASFT